MIYIGTTISSTLESNSQDFFKSVEKNDQHQHFCCAINMKNLKTFINDHKSFNFINLDIKNVSSKYYDGWPENRQNFVSLQTGEFVEYIECDDDDVVIFCDYDITMQKPLTNAHIEMFSSIDENTFLLEYDHFPPIMCLHDYCLMFKPICGDQKIFELFPENMKSLHVYNAGVIVAKFGAWKKLWKNVSNVYCNISNFRHHGAIQFLLNHCMQIDGLRIQNLPFDIHNAFWFNGTKSYEKNRKLHIDGIPVVFSHHKFMKTYSF